MLAGLGTIQYILEHKPRTIYPFVIKSRFCEQILNLDSYILIINEKNFSIYWHEKIVFSRQFVDVLNHFIGCQQNLGKNSIFIM